ncbi:MAG: hypothetical protein JWM21_1771 [Acidobacteria bacterium]|nr:hypothetical protein [Acidobacteriota bacterium]
MMVGGGPSIWVFCLNRAFSTLSDSSQSRFLSRKEIAKEPIEFRGGELSLKEQTNPPSHTDEINSLGKGGERQKLAKA